MVTNMERFVLDQRFGKKAVDSAVTRLGTGGSIGTVSDARNEIESTTRLSKERRGEERRVREKGEEGECS